MTEGGGPASENKASIYSRLHSKQGEAQWTQAPDRDTDTLPRITGHGPATLSAPKASVVSGVLACFGLPSSPLCPQCCGAQATRATTASEHHRCKVHQTQTWDINNQGAVDLLLCAAVARNHWWVSVSPCSNVSRYSWLSSLHFFLSLYFHSPNHTVEMSMHCTR